LPEDEVEPSATDGLQLEKEITDRLRQLGMQMEQSHELDHVFKIDALITEDDALEGEILPVALQLTKRTRKTRKKMETFLRESAKATKGPLLYVEMRGDVTPNMASGLRAAILALWFDKDRRHRAHGIKINSTGRYRWFDIRERIREGTQQAAEQLRRHAAAEARRQASAKVKKRKK